MHRLTTGGSLAPGAGKGNKERKVYFGFKTLYHLRKYHSRFCNPGEGHEKGLVEDLVGCCRRNFLVPVPRVDTWEELNAVLAARCRQYIEEHQAESRDVKVKEAYTLERRALTALPLRPYEAVKVKEARVDTFATVVYETNHYSVPVTCAGKTVTLRISPFVIDICYRGDTIASHSRTYHKHRTIYQLEHYLPLLTMRPPVSVQCPAGQRSWLARGV